MSSQAKNNRVAAAINEVNSIALYDEIEYRIELQKDEGHKLDYYTALNDAEQMAEDYQDRALLTAARKALIKLGVYRAMTETQLANTFTSGGKNYAFKMDGKKYAFERHL